MSKIHVSETALEAATKAIYEDKGDRKGVMYIGWDHEPEDVKAQWRVDVRFSVEKYLAALPGTVAQPSPRCVVCGSGDTMTICEGCWTRQPDQAVDRLREALTLGRDAVMESFEYVKSNDDQLMADARLQSIDAALAGLPSVTSTESLPPDWKQDQAETSRLAPRVSSTGGGTAA
jgi:hypothetical protein